MNTIIRSRKWKLLFVYEGKILSGFVREFYANLHHSTTSLTSTVREKKVDASPQALCRIYNREYVTRACGIDPYTRLIFEDRIRPEHVLERIAIEGAQWEFKECAPKRINSKFLLSEPFRWFLFIAANIMPTQNTDYASYERCCLIYAILTSIDVDIEYLITERMWLCKFKKSTTGWYFPLLITQLCLAAGVLVTQEEERLPIPPPLSENEIRLMLLDNLPLMAK